MKKLSIKTIKRISLAMSLINLSIVGYYINNILILRKESFSFLNSFILVIALFFSYQDLKVFLSKDIVDNA